MKNEKNKTDNALVINLFNSDGIFLGEQNRYAIQKSSINSHNLHNILLDWEIA